MVPPPTHVVQSARDGGCIDVITTETLEQFVGVETDRLDHTLLHVELLLDLLQMWRQKKSMNGFKYNFGNCLTATSTLIN